jgi:hypothetical protein
MHSWVRESMHHPDVEGLAFVVNGHTIDKSHSASACRIIGVKLPQPVSGVQLSQKNTAVVYLEVFPPIGWA